jgi:transposase InsO family protein
MDRATCPDGFVAPWIVTRSAALRTRPYRPETNGKAERFIQTMLLGWACKRAYQTSKYRTSALSSWLRYYNERRPHRSLGMNPPLKRLRLAT